MCIFFKSFSFFPEILQKVFAFLPFSAITYVPVMIYLGKYSGLQVCLPTSKSSGTALFGALQLLLAPMALPPTSPLTGSFLPTGGKARKVLLDVV